MKRPARLALFVLAPALLVAACDDSSDSSPPPPTATVAATATATLAPPNTPTPPPTATATNAPPAAVVGLAVLADDVRSAADDALLPPPPDWQGEPESASFSRAFSHADWVLHGTAGRSGTTAADGSFRIDGLAPGNYTLELRKTLNGNLVTVVAPVTVGDDGAAEILIQIDQGRVRAASTYTTDGRQVREVAGPDDSRVVIKDGRVVEVEDPHRHLIDPDGDGRFDPTRCLPQALWLCDDATAECSDGLVCQCTASCPFCEDCGPPVCAPPLPYAPYACSEDGACEQPGDVCSCVSSCPECDDCALSVCVPACSPAEIESIRIAGPSEVVVGRRASLRAVAHLADGSSLDVTYSASWSSTNVAVASVDSWGTVHGRATGEVDIRATFGDFEAEPHALAVVERPAVNQVEIHIQDCIVPYAFPPFDAPAIDAPFPDEFFPYPACREVVRVGTRTQLIAFATYADGTFGEVTREVEWAVTPTSVATVDEGVFTGLASGEALVVATLGAATSNDLRVRVVDEATVVQLSIHPEYAIEPPIFLPFFVDDPLIAAPPADCFDCVYQHTLLVGDAVQFRATARFDTGEWEDVTETATWTSAAPATAPIDPSGVLTASSAGSTTVQATLDGVGSNEVIVDVVAEATLQHLYVYPEGDDRVVGKGGDAYFRAQGTYDVGFGRDVTEVATWHSSDPGVGVFTAPGVFTGRAAGDVEVWATLDGQASRPLPMSVFETSEITYCDPNDVNRGTWSDAFNRVTLESDCREYTPPAVAELRFTVTERERPVGIFDPCLDLYVFQNGRRIRTIREEGCGEPFLAPGAPEMDAEAPRFQLKAFWDLKDDNGNVVPPGVYTIYGRFYLYFDPVVRIEIGVTAPDGLIPCVIDDCGNGCGWVRSCTDATPPFDCPDECTETCECPPGWGITPEGGCEPCAQECCPPGSACLPGVEPCVPQGERIPCVPTDCGNGCGWQRRCGDPEPPPIACPDICLPACECPVGWGLTAAGDCERCARDCCLPGEVCPDDLPSCSPECCPPGDDCGPDVPLCEPACCPPNARCTPDVPPCEEEPRCCPPGEPCNDDLPPCEEAPCCPEGAFCGPVALPPCGPPHCCPLGALCGPLDLPVCEQRCCHAGEQCDRESAWDCEACCDPTGSTPCIQGMPTCVGQRTCCPAGERCDAALPPCEPECCPSATDCPDDRIVCEEPPPPCVVTGCSGQLCAPEETASTCEFLPEYACYRQARCGLRDDGSCGWEPTEELRRCLQEARDR